VKRGAESRASHLSGCKPYTSGRGRREVWGGWGGGEKRGGEGFGEEKTGEFI